MLTLAALWMFVTGCASTKGAADVRPNALVEGNTESIYKGYRLEVSADAQGVPVRAQAYNSRNEPVPTSIVGLRDVTVCVPKSPDVTAQADKYCAPLSDMPDGTDFKIGTSSTCQHKLDGKMIVYECPP
jgi:hypothetical protein